MFFEATVKFVAHSHHKIIINETITQIKTFKKMLKLIFITFLISMCLNESVSQEETTVVTTSSTTPRTENGSTMKEENSTEKLNNSTEQQNVSNGPKNNTFSKVMTPFRMMARFPYAFGKFFTSFYE